ncbi:MAG: hypothetical protein D6698_01305 [Gammaproteobacteria bacterium]|nr:MAG: hypothetical protein D6698_01305 [Gammaproteobacteria bacterium]
MNQPFMQRIFYILAVIILMALGGCGGADNKKGNARTVSGTVLVAANTIADSDTHDRNAPQISNSTPSAAQDLPNPGTAGGYVDRSTGDIDDYYLSFLNQNDDIVLFLADATNADLRLTLLKFDPNSQQYTIISTSDNAIQPQIEKVKAPARGEYLIQVEAVRGQTNYQLSVGQGIAPASLPANDFIPGEILVGYTPSVVGVTTSLQIGGYTLKPSGHDLGTSIRSYTLQRSQVTGILSRSSSITASETLQIIKQLRQRPDVRYAEPNYRYYPLAITTPNDPFFASQWNLSNIKLIQGWQQVGAGTPVEVAVLDSGIRFDHPDLSTRFIPDNTFSTGHAGYDFLPAGEGQDGDGPDDDPTDPGVSSFTGSTFHGTLVSGVIAAETNNTTGISGVANTAEIRLLPLRVLSSQGGSTVEICQAIRFAAGLAAAGGHTLSKPVGVINMSFGTPSFSQALQDCISQARNQGVILIAAAGNESSSLPIYPAAYPGVISVSATTLNKDLASYSNTGSTIDIAAPGGDTTQDLNNDGQPDGILTTAATNNNGIVQFGYVYATGTSLATPHVTGVIALMKWIYPSLDPQTLDQWLASGFLTEDLTPASSGPDNRFGYGLLDANKALTEATSAAGGTPIVIPPLLTATPRAINFGATIDSLNLNLSNNGAGSLTVQAPTIVYQSGNNWLTINSMADSNGLGNYQVTVNRNGLLPGNYTATINFGSTANSVGIPVNINVPRVDINASTGYVYFLLTRATDDTVTDTDSGLPKNGRYQFSFSNVSPGDYHLFIGSDMNGDNKICDPGEACGAYAALDQILAIHVDQKSIVDIKATTAFRLNQRTLSLAYPLPATSSP